MLDPQCKHNWLPYVPIGQMRPTSYVCGFCGGTKPAPTTDISEAMVEAAPVGVSGKRRYSTPDIEEVIHWLDQKTREAQYNARRYRVSSTFWDQCVSDMRYYEAASSMLTEFHLKEKSHASQKREVEKDDLGQHPHGDEGRPAAEAGSGDSALDGAREEETGC